MSKLTLSVDAQVVRQAKRYAAKRGTSVSQLVEQYLTLVTRPSAAEGQDPPVLRMLRGAAAKLEADAYGKYLTRKYR